MQIIDLIRRELRYCDMCQYSIEYSEAAQAVVNSNNFLSAEEHTMMSENDFQKYCISQENFIEWYFNYLSNIKKLDALGCVANIAKEKNVKNIISFGSGPCVLEFFLKKILGGGREYNCHGL